MRRPPNPECDRPPQLGHVNRPRLDQDIGHRMPNSEGLRPKQNQSGVMRQVPRTPLQLPRITERKRRHPPRILVQDQAAGDRRLGALAAVFAFAQPAVDADRGGFGLVEIEAGGIA